MLTDRDFEIAYLRLMQGLGTSVALTNRFLQMRASWDRAGRPAMMEFYIADWLGMQATEVTHQRIKN